MKRYLFRRVALVFLLFVLSSVISYSDAASLKSQIIGKWVEVEDGKFSIEFLKDGTVVLGNSAVGDFKFIDDNRLRMDIKGIFGQGAVVFEVSIDKAGQLTLKEPTGEVTKFITEALAKKRKEASTYINQGVKDIKEERYDQAIENFKRAIAIDSNYAKAYIDRGFAYSKKGQYDRAIEDYNKAIAIDPKNAKAYNNRGYAYRKKGQYDKAIEDYNKAISIKPSFGYFGRARTYSLQNNESFACDSLRLAFENADEKQKTEMRGKLDDSDFNNIRNSSCFKKIVSRIEKR